jgi:tRNA (cytidine/uridine-2'-O-)-methyltransferase
MFHIVLISPLIPQNTGNIARTCAVTGTALHLVKPLGFSVDEKHVKRSGLDYWDKVNVSVHECFDDLVAKYPDAPFYLAETVGSRRYDTVLYPKGAFFVFGQETKGLPAAILSRFPDNLIRLPMRDTLRSLNLSNAAAIVLYEALRQHDFSGLS